MTLEACTNSVQSAINAQKGGANRVELCDNLSQGGTTPSFATIALTRQYLDIDLYVLIRPREGDFLYSDLEFEIIKKDIEQCKALGVDGVVIGLLTASGEIDMKRTQTLIELAKPMDITFHRAFDMVKNPNRALEQLIDLKIPRILTSGLAQNAPLGFEQIKALHQQAKGGIQLMVGGGIRPNNVQQFINIGIQEFHLSGNHWLNSKMDYTNPKVTFSSLPNFSELKIQETKVDTIRIMRQILDR